MGDTMSGRVRRIFILYNGVQKRSIFSTRFAESGIPKDRVRSSSIPCAPILVLILDVYKQNLI